jgi:glycosyltransferase involved in cell wall biosynthesis
MIFSVIVPFLDREKYIERCVRSLLDQDFDKSEYEVIFIDNGSTDASSAIVSRFKEIILLREDERGAYKARNRGLGSAKGEIIAFTDADCVVSKDWLTGIYRGMTDKGATIVLGEVLFPANVSLPLKMFADYQNARIEYFIEKGLKKYFYGYTNNMAVRAEVFRKAGLFKEWDRGGDTEMVHRCVAGYPGCEARYLSGVKVEHLEVYSLGVWLSKMFAYGKSGVSVARVSGYTLPGLKERLDIYAYCSVKNKYHILKKTLLIFVLAAGFLCFEYGRIMGKIRAWKGPDVKAA